MDQGYEYLPNFLDHAQVKNLEIILRKFHESWLKANEASFHAGAVNSAYITKGSFLTSEERLSLLKFVSSKQVVSIAKKFLGEDLRFLNTQLFFNPYNEGQKNYWHRDIQYTGMSIEQQVKTLEAQEFQVIHLRFALEDENGIEVVTGSQFRWDNEEELDVRFQRNGKTSSDPLLNSKALPLKRGDLLVFDANIIHRGLYGKDRFAFDILFCKPLPDIIKFIEPSILPTANEITFLETPEIF